MKNRWRFAILVAVLILFAAFFVFDLGRYFAIDALKVQQVSIVAYRAAHPWLATLIYFVVYVVMTGLSLPGAAVLTLAGGALFGVIWGTVVVSFASSLGAALAFLALRLVPAFPFFLVNIAMGLSVLPVRTFYWVSQVGMLAGTIVYVNAGTQLAKVHSLSGILSPTLLASFAVL